MSDTCLMRIEDYWKDKTTASNELFNDGNFKDALVAYKNALSRAEMLNNNYTDCIRVGIPFLQLYVISCNNLANTYLELNKKNEAESLLKRVVYYLLHIARKGVIPKTEMQSELKRATLAYVRFTGKTDTGKVKQEQLFKTVDNAFFKTNKLKK